MRPADITLEQTKVAQGSPGVASNFFQLSLRLGCKCRLDEQQELAAVTRQSPHKPAGNEARKAS